MPENWTGCSSPAILFDLYQGVLDPRRRRFHQAGLGLPERLPDTPLPLLIDLPQAFQDGQNVQLTVDYRTTYMVCSKLMPYREAAQKGCPDDSA